MKLILAVVSNDDAGTLNNALVKHKFNATRLATTGGFLRRGNTTMLIGVEEERVEELRDLIRRACSQRQEVVPAVATAPFGAGLSSGLPVEVTVGGATVFVLDVERFEKL